MYPQISVAGSIKIKSVRNKHWPEIYIQNDFLKYHVLNLVFIRDAVFIPIQISYSSPTAILPEILIVAYRSDLRTFTEITEKIQKSLHLNK